MRGDTELVDLLVMVIVEVAIAMVVVTTLATLGTQTELKTLGLFIVNLGVFQI